MAAKKARLGLAGAAAVLAWWGAVPAGAQTPSETLSPSTLAFGPVLVGTSSDPQQLTFSSAARLPVTIRGVGVTGEFGLAPGGCTAGTVVGLGTPCRITVVFTPTSPGNKAGTVTVQYGTDSTLTAALSGTATQATTTSAQPTTTAAPTTTAPPSTTTSTRPSTSTSGPTVTVVPTTLAPTVPPETTTTTRATTRTTAPPAPAVSGPTLSATAADGGRSGPPGIGLTVVGTGYPAGGGRALAPRQLAAATGLAQAGASCDTVYIFIDGRRIGSVGPDAAGGIRRSGLSVPGDVDPGRHDVTASCRASGAPALAASPFEVTEAAMHRTALATSLPRADQVDFGLVALLLSALAVAGMLVLIAFPAELFNTTLEAHYDEVRGWFRLRPRDIAGGRHHGLLLAVFLLLSGPLWFAMQPSSGLDPATAWGALGLSLATAAVVFASDMPEVVHVRARYGERPRPVVLPGSIVVALACVALSRAVHFQPGYFYGLIGGLALSRTLARDESGRLAARTVAMLLALSVGAWVALLPVSAAAAESGKTYGIILVENLLGGVFWAALDSLVLAMLPLRLLQGAKVTGWSRGAWAVLYGLTLLAFVHILLRPSTGYVSNTTASPAVVVVGLFAAFAAFSFAFWGYFRFRPERSAGPAPSASKVLPDEVEGAPRPEPGDVLVGQGVGAGEVEGRPVGAVEPAGDGPVGGEPGQAQDRDPV